MLILISFSIDTASVGVSTGGVLRSLLLLELDVLVCGVVVFLLIPVLGTVILLKIVPSLAFNMISGTLVPISMILSTGLFTVVVVFCSTNPVSLFIEYLVVLISSPFLPF